MHCQYDAKRVVGQSKKRNHEHFGRAIVVAAEGHACVKDKGGTPYFFHPLRMMLGLSLPDERIVAALHDVCEDCLVVDVGRNVKLRDVPAPITE